MKKTISVILALSLMLVSLFALGACRKNETAIFGLAASASPTKTVTIVEYVTADGEQLAGQYTMQVEGDNSIFEFTYERFRTVQDGFVDESYDRIKTVSGTVYYKDGLFSEDGDEWETGVPTALDLRFDLKEEYLTSVSVDETDTVLTAEIAPENVAKVLGTDLSANGNVSITVETNGVSLTKVYISCTTDTGASLSIRTSYTYNPITLTFPSDEADA